MEAQRRLIGALALAAALGASAASAASAAELGFVYVSANVGGASGGHAALVAGRTVYHVQSAEDGLVRLARGSWSHFRYVYADLENRPLRVAHVQVSEAARERVLGFLARSYVEQELGLARRDALRADVAWLGAYAAHTPPPPLAFAGLVAPERAGDPDAAALREALVARLGAGALEALAADARAQVEAMARAPGVELEPLREQLALVEALDSLVLARGLEPAALVALPAQHDEPLGDDERAGLAVLEQALAESAAQLLGSTRPDRGHALLVAQARFLAVRRSLAENRLRVLDPFAESASDPDGPNAIAPEARAKLVAHAASLLREGRAQVLGARRDDEPAYNLLEEAAGVLERVHTASEGDALRDLGRMRVPARARAVAAPPLALDAEAALVSARAALAVHEASLEASAKYDLFRRNCITELVRATNEPFDSPEQVTAAFGGRIEPDEPLGFIPFVFFGDVQERLRVVRVDELPSHRQRELARLARDEPGLATRLRESSPLSSTVYTPLARDGAFLLFSDDVFWRRPLYGAVNLAFATGYTAYGVAAAPFDRGARASMGLRGALWSVPELVFQNVRKGSFDWVDAPREPRVP